MMGNVKVLSVQVVFSCSCCVFASWSGVNECRFVFSGDVEAGNGAIHLVCHDGDSPQIILIDDAPPEVLSHDLHQVDSKSSPDSSWLSLTAKEFKSEPGNETYWTFPVFGEKLQVSKPIRVKLPVRWGHFCLFFIFKMKDKLSRQRCKVRWAAKRCEGRIKWFASGFSSFLQTCRLKIH